MKTKLKYDIIEDYKAIVDQYLSSLGYTPPGDLHDSLVIYFNYKRRTITANPRTILYSNKCHCPPDLQTGFDNLVRSIKNGDDISPYLSKNLKKADYSDPLLNDWNIYHLHLGDTIEPDGFVKRTGRLLFAMFDENNSYFLGINNHGSWSDKTLLEIALENWPEYMEQFELKGILDISFDPSSEEVGKLRNEGMNTVVKIGKKFYTGLGGGYTASGRNTMVMIRANDTISQLQKINEDVK